MANLSPDDDAASETESINAELPDPNPHGQIRVSDAHHDPKGLVAQLRTHLAQHVSHMATTADYGGHGTAARQGAFSPGGASGADCSTGSQDTPDADSGGPSGY
jgi:hypothetical protein